MAFQTPPEWRHTCKWGDNSCISSERPGHPIPSGTAQSLPSTSSSAAAIPTPCALCSNFRGLKCINYNIKWTCTWRGMAGRKNWCEGPHGSSLKGQASQFCDYFTKAALLPLKHFCCSLSNVLSTSIYTDVTHLTTATHKVPLPPSLQKTTGKNHCESKISSWSSSLLDEEALRTRWYTRFGMLRTAMGIWGEHKGELLDQKLSPWSHLTLPYAQPCRSSRNGKIQTPSAFRTLPQRCLQWADISHSLFLLQSLKWIVMLRLL